jgi:tRNA threonylcarbamoyladenosine biosynthesis protein TsaB
MMILALESSAKPASVAVYNDGKLLGQYFQNSEFSHSRTLLAMAESLLKNLSLKPSDIGLVAVAHGPGSFTGVRIGVSAAKGLTLGLDIPVCGVSTLEAIAYQTLNPDIIICPVMDARREQVYNAFFEWENGSLIRLCDDRAISLEDLAVELRELAKPCLLVGDGATISYDYLSQEGIQCKIAPELLRYQTAYGVALAALHTEPISAAALEPNYLRPSQAERERKV